MYLHLGYFAIEKRSKKKNIVINYNSGGKCLAATFKNQSIVITHIKDKNVAKLSAMLPL